jgi:hypothetical protein
VPLLYPRAHHLALEKPKEPVESSNCDHLVFAPHLRFQDSFEAEEAGFIALVRVHAFNKLENVHLARAIPLYSCRLLLDLIMDRRFLLV